MGNYDGSTGELLELAGKNDGSELLWRLMAASTLHFTNGREAEAIAHFDHAERVMQRNDQMSVFAQGGEGALAMMSNDRVFSYDGGGLDRVFTCVYRGIDFLCTGDRENTRVEFNRAATYQRRWLNLRRKDIDAAARKMSADAAASQRQHGVAVQDYSSSVNKAMTDSSFGATIRGQTGFDPATSGRLDALPQSAYVNAYAAHLTGVFRWINGDTDVGDLKLAAAVKPGNPLIARDFAECGQGGRPSNQVWIWAEDGLCPIREEWRVDLPLFLIPYASYFVKHAGMALPVLRARAYGATVWNALAVHARRACARNHARDRQGGPAGGAGRDGRERARRPDPAGPRTCPGGRRGVVGHDGRRRSPELDGPAEARDGRAAGPSGGRRGAGGGGRTDDPRGGSARQLARVHPQTGPLRAAGGEGGDVPVIFSRKMCQTGRGHPPTPL